MLKVYIKNITYMLLILIGSTFLFTLLSYFDIINNKFMAILKFIVPIVTFLFGGFYLSKSSIKKGIVEGLKIGLICTLLIILISLLTLNGNLSLKNIIYYIVLIFSSILGGILAKQIKKDSNK